MSGQYSRWGLCLVAALAAGTASAGESVYLFAPMAGTEAAPRASGKAKYVSDQAGTTMAVVVGSLPAGDYTVLAVPAGDDPIVLGTMEVGYLGRGLFVADTGMGDEIPDLRAGDGVLITRKAIPVAFGVFGGR